ncbi:MAG: hypothetical protein PHR77_08290 [Kiritimatiellae bacterium]|nr:hypothetical protein [Kiritimatiellia bacterium]MDD5522818.1 hypothetical protein [Kiritimatiellia bacterium]
MKTKTVIRITVGIMGIISIWFLSFSPSNLSACLTPVFQYALERWEPDLYQVQVTCRESQTNAFKEVSDLLSRYVGDETRANIDVSFVHTNISGSASFEPVMTVYYPPSLGINAPLWTGKFTKENVEKIINSSFRHGIVKSIIEGTSIVWVFLESGEKEKDDKIYEFLEKELKTLQAVLKFQGNDLEAGPGFASVGPPIRFSFSPVRLSRNNPEEAFFISNLLNMSPELLNSKQPMAFPVYGRGRVLPPLEGEGINSNILRMACEFLTGSCSCEIKDQNPGIDLLLLANWQAAGQGYTEVALPSLTSVMPAQDDTKQKDLPSSGRQLHKPDDSRTQLPVSGAKVDGTNDGNRRIVKHVMIILGMAAAVIVLISISVFRGQRK